MDELPSIGDYHSAAMLLPSGKVMMAGWNNTKIELYSPPYLFNGARPVISTAIALCIMAKASLSNHLMLLQLQK
jgi:hypothetical protein